MQSVKDTYYFIRRLQSVKDTNYVALMYGTDHSLPVQKENSRQLPYSSNIYEHINALLYLESVYFTVFKWV